MKIIFSLILLTQFNTFAKDYVVEAFEVKGRELMIFKPSFLHINVGDHVTFKPIESFTHRPQSIFQPEGANPWQAQEGKPITVEFKKEGIHIFNCKYHFVMGMAGVIQVGKATNYSQAKDFVKAYESKVAMKKDRLNKIFLKVNSSL